MKKINNICCENDHSPSVPCGSGKKYKQCCGK
ncbi:MAG: SEC-C domain-containing protein [Bacilli bacterium]|nr:SEC-C domain-containing protein [Bacilli bacterium]